MLPAFQLERSDYERIRPLQRSIRKAGSVSFFARKTRGNLHICKKSSNFAAQTQMLDSKGMKPAELKLAESLVEENKEMIIERWKTFFAK